MWKLKARRARNAGAWHYRPALRTVVSLAPLAPLGPGKSDPLLPEPSMPRPHPKRLEGLSDGGMATRDESRVRDKRGRGNPNPAREAPAAE